MADLSVQPLDARARQIVATGGPGRDLPARAMGTLIVSDDPALCYSSRSVLEGDGHRVQIAGGTAAACGRLADGPLDLVLLDLAVADLAAVGALRRARPDPHLVTVGNLAAGVDRVAALLAGADDHLDVPFTPLELSACSSSIARRRADVHAVCCPGPQEATAAGVLRFGQLHIDTVARRVTLAGTPVELTRRELDLLLHLARNPDRVFSREELLEAAWGSSSDWQGVATVTEHIRRIRLKLELLPDPARLIATVRSGGYRFDPPGPEQ